MEGRTERRISRAKPVLAAKSVRRTGLWAGVVGLPPTAAVIDPLQYGEQRVPRHSLIVRAPGAREAA